MACWKLHPVLCMHVHVHLFSKDEIHVYKCTTHRVSLVGSELRVTVCVCALLVNLCVCACLSGSLRCGPIWGVSKEAGERHACCSLGSSLMQFNPVFSSPLSSQCSIIVDLFILALSVCGSRCVCVSVYLFYWEWKMQKVSEETA